MAMIPTQLYFRCFFNNRCDNLIWECRLDFLNQVSVSDPWATSKSWHRSGHAAVWKCIHNKSPSLHSNVWPRSLGPRMLLWGGRHPKTDIALVTLQHGNVFMINLLVSIPTFGWGLWVPACRYEEATSKNWHRSGHDVVRTYIHNKVLHNKVRQTLKCYDPNTFHPFNLAAFGVPGLPIWPMSNATEISMHFWKGI